MSQACPQCGSGNDDDQAACFTCGRPLQEAVRLGEVIGSRYEIRSRLGRGGMGAVYRAYDRVLEEDVALKVLREDATDGSAARRFRTEIKLARRVIHRNVCRIFEYGEEKGRRFISMELVEGTDLKHAIAQQRGFAPDRAFSVALQVADGLAAIHQVGIIHRDLKTSNIMLDASGTVRLMDFGIAKHVNQDAAAATATGDILGTPAYMSPEQARAESLDFRSDVYALGIVTYELFTGRVPFQADSPIALILKQIHEAPAFEGPRAAAIPRAVVPVLAKALAKAREDRFQSVREMALALSATSGRAAREPGPEDETISQRDSGTPTLQLATTAVPESELRRAPARSGHARPPTPAATVVPPKGGSQSDVPTLAKTVLRPRRSGERPGIARPALAVAILVVAGGIAIAAWSWVHPSLPEATPAPAPVPATLPVAPTKWSVSIVAVPWARITIRVRGEATPIAGGEVVTPCQIQLAAGQYTAELENGGITPALTQDFEVTPGARNDLLFNMPPFDAAAAARTAAEGRR